MRSYIVAAMAALMGSVPMTTASAAPFRHSDHGGHFAGGGHRFEAAHHFDGGHGGSGFHGHGHFRRGGGAYFGYYGDDYSGWNGPYYDYSYYPAWTPAPLIHVRGTRLGIALGDLRTADARIATARARREISPAVARHLYARDAAIRREALYDAGRSNGLTIPAYRSVMAQIGTLNRTIARDAGMA